MIEPGRYVCLSCNRRIDAGQVRTVEITLGRETRSLSGCVSCVGTKKVEGGVKACGTRRFYTPDELPSGRKAAKAAKGKEIAQRVAAELD